MNRLRTLSQKMLEADPYSTRNSTNNKNISISWISAIYTLILVGMLVVLFTSMNFTEGSVVGNIVGYSVMLLGVILLIGNIYNKIPITNLFDLTIPSILLLATLTFNIIMTSLFFKDIAKESIPYYGTFSFIILLMTFSQIYLLKEQTNKYNIRLSTLFGLINLVTATTMFIILKYYPTDC